MTAAHLPGAILTPRCRGARAVASFNAAERHGATNQIQRIPVGQLSGSANAARGFCLAVGSAAPFNGRNAQVDAPATAVPVLCSRHTREIDTRPSAISNAVSNAEQRMNYTLRPVNEIPRPFAHMQPDALADEITVARECIQTTRDLRLRKQMQQKLAELLAEEGRRFTDGLPF